MSSGRVSQNVTIGSQLPSASSALPPQSFFVQAIYAYSGAEIGSLSFKHGDLIEVLSTLATGWWDGVVCHKRDRGWFPSNYVTRVSEEEAARAREQMRAWWEPASGDTAQEGDNELSNTQEAADYDASQSNERDRKLVEGILNGGVDVDRDLKDFSNGGDIFSEIAIASVSASEASPGASPERVVVTRDSLTRSRGKRKSAGSQASSSRRTIEDDEGDEEDTWLDFWVPRMTRSGHVFYYNTQTGETSRDMPIDRQGDGVAVEHDLNDVELAGSIREKRQSQGSHRSSSHSHVSRRHSRTKSKGSSSSDKGQTRLRPGRQNVDETSRNSMAGSLVSERTLAAPPPRDKFEAPKIVPNYRRTNSEASDDSIVDAALLNGEAALTATSKSGTRRLNPSRGKPIPSIKKTVSSAGLLEPPLPSLLVDHEHAVIKALEHLVEQVGLGESRMSQGTLARDLTGEKDRLAALADAVVAAVRNLFHATGVLEHLGPALPPPLLNHVRSNEIIAATLPQYCVSVPNIGDLKPAIRKLTSSLFKLFLGARAIWGLLDTTEDDLQIDSLEETEDLEESARQSRIQEQVLSGWERVKEARSEMDARLRADALSGAAEFRDIVTMYIRDFERSLAGTKHHEGEDSSTLNIRAPKSLQGALRTSAAALLRPGGGYGGNWRGNGFVTLPTPDVALNSASTSHASAVGLRYTYPSKSLNPETAAAFELDVEGLLSEAEAIKAISGPPLDPANNGTPAHIRPLSTSLHQSKGPTRSQRTSRRSLRPLNVGLLTIEDGSLDQLSNCALAFVTRLGTFMASVEELDIAGSIDTESSGEAQSRPGSRPDFVFASGSVSTLGGSTRGTDAGSIDQSAIRYRVDNSKTRTLLAELEDAKQRTYDLSSLLLIAVQHVHGIQQGDYSKSFSGVQPPANSPFPPFSAVDVSRQSSADSLQSIISRCMLSVETMSNSLTSLAAFTESESVDPKSLRLANMAFRDSLFDVESQSSSSIAESRVSARDRRQPRVHGSMLSMSTSSSHQSSHRALDEESAADVNSQGRTSQSRDSESIDGDFPPRSAPFFHEPASSSASASQTSLLQKSQPGESSPILLHKAKLRRDSGETSSSYSSSVALVKDLPATVNTSPAKSTSSSKHKLQWLTGDRETPVTPTSPKDATASWLGSDLTPDEISFNMEGQIRGGTLRALVIASTSHEGRMDSSYLSAFLTTYRTFCTSFELLHLLEQRFFIDVPQSLSMAELTVWESQKQKPIQARVANVVKLWVRDYMDNEEVDEELLRHIADFASAFGQGSEGQVPLRAQSLQIVKAVEDRLSGGSTKSLRTMSLGVSPPPIASRNLRPGKIKILEIDPLELARQLTMMDSHLFSKITPQECLAKAWPKQFSSDTPNISSMIDMSNAVTRWVSETILAQEDVKRRSAIIKHFITVAERCLSLNNFSTLIHVVAALNSTPIHRLKRTWESMSQKYTSSLAQMNNLIRPDKNYKEYRDALRVVAPPCVPFLGVYLTDWTFIGDGNPDMLREKPHHINFNKRQKASELILVIKVLQSMAYNFTDVPVLRRYLEESLFPPHANGGSDANDGQRLYEVSLQREPREREDEKLSRLLQESGFF